MCSNGCRRTWVYASHVFVTKRIKDLNNRFLVRFVLSRPLIRLCNLEKERPLLVILEIGDELVVLTRRDLSFTEESNPYSACQRKLFGCCQYERRIHTEEGRARRTDRRLFRLFTQRVVHCRKLPLQLLWRRTLRETFLHRTPLHFHGQLLLGRLQLCRHLVCGISETLDNLRPIIFPLSTSSFSPGRLCREWLNYVFSSLKSTTESFAMFRSNSTMRPARTLDSGLCKMPLSSSSDESLRRSS